MKNVSYLLIAILVCLNSCKTIKPTVAIRPEVAEIPVAVPNDEPVAINFAEQSTWLLGYFNLNRLTSYPYSSWYMKEYDEYQFNSDAVNKLADINKDSLTIKIVLGTWCPDSRREVPRFMRILNIWQFSDTKVTFIGVDDTKVAPVGEYNNLNIQRVPTFIIYKNNIEAGRIIEVPKTSLEQDIYSILVRNE